MFDLLDYNLNNLMNNNNIAKKMEKMQEYILNLRKNQILGRSSGESIIVKDSAEDFCKLYSEDENGNPCFKWGNMKQEEREGYNELTYPYVNPAYTQAGIAYTPLEDGRVKANGTSTADGGNCYYNIANKNTVDLIEGEKYTFYANSTNENLKLSMLYDDGNGYKTLFSTNTVQTVTIPSGIQALVLRVITSNSGVTLNDAIISPMIVRGTDTTKPFEKYGKTPSPKFSSKIECVEAYNMLDINLPYNTNPSASTTRKANNVPILEPNKKYYLYAKSSDGTSMSASCEFLWKDSGNNTIFSSLPNKIINGSDVSNATNFYVYTNSALANKTVTEIMICEVKEVTTLDNVPSYQPYGVVSFKAQNKNWFDIEDFYSASSSVSNIEKTKNSIKYNAPSSWTGVFYRIDIESAKYILSIGNITAGARLEIQKKDADGNNIGSVITTTGATREIDNTDGKAKWLQIILTNQIYIGEVEFSNIQLEKGTTVTQYVSHQENIYPVHLGDKKLYGKNTARDYAYKNLANGNWYHRHLYGRKVYDGSSDEAWGLSGYTANNNYYIKLYDFEATETSLIVPNIMCNYLEAKTWYLLFNNNNVNGISTDGSSSELKVSLDKSILNRDLAEFKQWLSNHPLEVIYKLKAPVDELITDTELIADLENMLLNSKTFEGTTEITTDSIANLEMEYTVSNKIREDIQNKRIEALEEALFNLGGVL